MTSQYGVPVTFDTFGGFYHAGQGAQQQRKAVLLLSPIGYEELCSRVTWRALAEAIADSGHACLRFDYPGMADAIDPSGAPDGIADWLNAARRGIAFLRAQNPGSDIVLVGQGIGASLAAQLGPELPDVVGAVLMAPVIKGRTYLRELQVWSRMLTEQMGIGPDPMDDNGYGVAGFQLPGSRAAAIKAIDLTRSTQAPAAQILLVERHQAGDSAIEKQFNMLGATVSAIDYAGYELMLQDPTLAAPQRATLTAIVAWIDALPSAATGAALVPMPAQPIAGPHYEELPLRFGPDARLFGVLCRPREAPSSAIAVLANSGRDHHIGWGRATVEQARMLARRGIASFRFDAGGIGESAAGPDAPEEILYSDAQIADLRHAIDFAETLRAGPIAVVGRCSGAYAAFQLAVDDARIRNVVVINIMRFVWDPEETVAEALGSAHRTMGGSMAMLFSRQSLRRLLSGNLRIRAPIMFFARKISRNVAARVGKVAAGQAVPSLYKEGHRRFQILDSRGVRLSMLFSKGDHALGEFRNYMGRSGAKLRRYSKASIAIIPDADHNFTHADARARLTTVLCDVLTAP